MHALKFYYCYVTRKCYFVLLYIYNLRLFLLPPISLSLFSNFLFPISSTYLLSFVCLVSLENLTVRTVYVILIFELTTRVLCSQARYFSKVYENSNNVKQICFSVNIDMQR